MISVFGDGLTTTLSDLGAAYPIHGKSISIFVNLHGYLSATSGFIQPFFSDDQITWYALAGVNAGSVTLVANTAVKISPYPIIFNFDATLQPATLFPMCFTIINPGLPFIKFKGQSVGDVTDVCDIRINLTEGTGFHGIQ